MDRMDMIRRLEGLTSLWLERFKLLSLWRAALSMCDRTASYIATPSGEDGLVREAGIIGDTPW